MNAMSSDPARRAVPLPPSPPGDGSNPITAARGRQILFYAAEGLLGGTFTCSRCGASGRQPDVIEHAPHCGYRRPDPSEPVS